MKEFFSYIDDPPPDLETMSPIQALSAYIEQCGGNADRTILHFVPPPPPPLFPEYGRRSTIKCIQRHIASQHYATSLEGNEVVWTELLCCWDDPAQKSKCIRQNCPYRHTSEMSEEHPFGGQDLFELIPCNFAGMGEGCKYHRHRLGTHKWVVPLFELTESSDEPAPYKPPRGLGFHCRPRYDGKQWILQMSRSCKLRPVKHERKEIDEEATRVCNAIIAATKRLLDGFDTDSDSGDDVSR